MSQTSNFGMYLETALGTNFCRLSDVKSQKDLLCYAALTAETALKKVRASELILKETEGMQAVKEHKKFCYYDCSNQFRQNCNQGVLLM